MHVPNDVWSFGLKDLSKFGCRFGDTFIVPDVTVSASVHIINMEDIGLWETDWISVT